MTLLVPALGLWLEKHIPIPKVAIKFPKKTFFFSAENRLGFEGVNTADSWSLGKNGQGSLQVDCLSFGGKG